MASVEQPSLTPSESRDVGRKTTRERMLELFHAGMSETGARACTKADTYKGRRVSTACNDWLGSRSSAAERQNALHQAVSMEQLDGEAEGDNEPALCDSSEEEPVVAFKPRTRLTSKTKSPSPLHTSAAAPVRKWPRGILKRPSASRTPMDEEIGGSATPAAQSAPPQPMPEDPILVLEMKWLQLIVAMQKTIELRGVHMVEQPYWLASGGHIYARAEITSVHHIKTQADWDVLRPEHCMERATPPFPKTYGHRLENVEVLPQSVPYFHPRGAVSRVRYFPTELSWQEARSRTAGRSSNTNLVRFAAGGQERKHAQPSCCLQTALNPLPMTLMRPLTMPADLNTQAVPCK